MDGHQRSALQWRSAASKQPALDRMGGCGDGVTRLGGGANLDGYVEDLDMARGRREEEEEQGGGEKEEQEEVEAE